jgi:putative transposase
MKPQPTPNRHSIRLKGYDYSKAGLYFITLCCQDRLPLFGQIVRGNNASVQMILNDAGHIADKCWLEIPMHYPNVILHEYVIMPNHIHGIIEIVGANNHSPITITNNHSPANVANNDIRAKNISPLPPPSPPNGTSKTIGAMVRGFKIGVTKWMRQNTTVHDVWQRNYYEHIIRNEQSYVRIAKYIINNPVNWQEDKFYKQ